MSDETTTQLLSLPVSPQRFRLRLLSGGRERLRTFRRGESLTLGSSAGADVTLDDPAVSGLHCKLEASERGIRVEDLGSTNGLFVGGSRVASAQLFCHGAAFSLGHTTVVVEHVPLERREDAEHESDDLGIVGKSEAIARLREHIRRVARLRGPVLILGESGAGKDLVARALHRLSRRSGPYLPINVAALSDSLIDAELFGHHRGAFTGAEANRPGAFEQAHGGTLFLDEIADLSWAGQSKVLRVVEDGQVRAVGSSTSRLVDVRLVSATCAPLQDRIDSGNFRYDLYQRLSTLVLHVPPLRERLEDVPILAETLLERMAADVGRKHLTPSALEALRTASYPGNVRQLAATLYRAAALHSGDLIEPGHLELPPPVRRSRRFSVEDVQELVEKYGSTTRAARAVGVPRTTLNSVLERHAGRGRSAAAESRPDSVREAR